MKKNIHIDADRHNEARLGAAILTIELRQFIELAIQEKFNSPEIQNGLKNIVFYEK